MKKQHITAEPLNQFQALWNRHFMGSENPEQLLKDMLSCMACTGMVSDAELGQHTLVYLNLSAFFEEFKEACNQEVDSITQKQAA